MPFDVSEQVQEYIEISRIGEKMLNFKMSDHYAAFKQYVLDVLDREAFEVFKKVVPTEQYEIIQAQMMSKCVYAVEAKIDGLINQGALARESLKTMSQEEETE